MKYLSLFSGIGGFELGIQQAYENNKIGKQKSVRKRSIRDSGERRGNIPSIRSRRRKSKQEKGHRLEQWECIGYSEINKYAIQIYEKKFPKHKNYGDITKINTKELPDFDLLIGGVPCQSWSIAGKRGGFDDERGNMWFQCFRILKAKQPKFFLFENVKGLLSHDGGNSMERICEELCKCEYAIDFEVLNSKDFGVPQNRARVFIIGIRLDLLDEMQIF